MVDYYAEIRAEALISAVLSDARQSFNLGDRREECPGKENWAPLRESLGPLSPLEEALVYVVWLTEMCRLKKERDNADT